MPEKPGFNCRAFCPFINPKYGELIMSSIKVVSNQAAREITVQEPVVMGCSTVEELVEALGEELVVNQVKNQLKVSFRAVVRRKLEEVDDNKEFVNSDEAIMAEDFSDWKPTLRVTKTAEEKATELLGSLSPEVRNAILAQYKNAN
jgi:hypothetical protein